MNGRWRPFFTLAKPALAALAILSGVVGQQGVASAADSAPETKIQAAFLYQFFNYIELNGRPASAQGAKDSLEIAVLGSTPLFEELQTLVAGRVVGGKKLKVVQLAIDAKAPDAEMIFIAADKASVLASAVARLHGSGSVTVSYGEGFAKVGAMINFYKEADSMRFEINRKAAEKEKVTFSSQLLKLARIIE